MENKELSYVIGLFQTDGTLNEEDGNRGRFKIELNIKDENIIHKISKLIKYNYKISTRDRITNFGKSSTITITVYNINFRNFLKEHGVPCGKKSEIISPPLHIKNLSIVDYVRGLYDGDGSLGMTEKNKPFISLTTSSENIKKFIVNYINEITGTPKKNPNRNKRDNIYNISLFNEDAIIFSNHLYYDNCLCINRKLEKSIEMKNWIRPSNVKKRENRKFWTKEQDDFILSNSIGNSIKELNRSKQSIEMRLWRLK